MSNKKLLVVGELNIDLILNQIQGFPVIGAEKIAENSKIQYVSNKCIKQEYQKLFQKANPVFPVLKN